MEGRRSHHAADHSGLSITPARKANRCPRPGLGALQLAMCKLNATHGNLFFSLSFLNEPLIKMLLRCFRRVGPSVVSSR